MRRLLAGLLVAGVAGLCAGCGSGGDTPSAAAVISTPTSVTSIEQTTTTTTAPTTTLTEPANPPASTATTGTATTPPTPVDPARARYITKADAVCASGNAAARKLNQRANTAIRGAANDTDRLKAIAPILKDGLQLQGAAIKRFKAIAPPVADRATITAYSTTLDQQIALLAQLADAAAAADLATYQGISARSTTLRARARELARNFGFTQCSNGSSAAA